MAAQLADKGHPPLQTVSADSFAKLLAECNSSKAPTAGMLKLIANGKKSLQKG
jgi:hypothetical protein